MGEIIKELKGPYFFLNNYSDSEIFMDQIVFRNAEAAYQAGKCTTHKEKVNFVNLPPNEAKFVGKTEVLPRADWEDIRLEYMKEVLYQKFTQSKKLKNKLLTTGDAKIEHNNHWHDNFWGNCTCPECADIEGENNLGRLLEEVREEIRDGKDLSADRRENGLFDLHRM